MGQGHKEICKKKELYCFQDTIKVYTQLPLGKCNKYGKHVTTTTRIIKHTNCKQKQTNKNYLSDNHSHSNFCNCSLKVKKDTINLPNKRRQRHASTYY